MSKKIKDTDYLVISARIRAMETGLLTGERMEQILAARSNEEVVKLLQEGGYPTMSLESPEAMDAAITAAREETLQDLGDSAPDGRYLDIFKLKYDYHNAKAILKAQAMGTDPDHMLADLGRVPAAELKETITSGDMKMCIRDRVPSPAPCARRVCALRDNEERGVSKIRRMPLRVHGYDTQFINMRVTAKPVSYTHLRSSAAKPFRLGRWI